MTTPVAAGPGPGRARDAEVAAAGVGRAPAAESPGTSDGGPPDAPTLRVRSDLPRALVMLVGCAAAFLVLGGLHLTAWLVGPVFLALIIVIAISPVQSALLRRGWPGWLTTLVLVVLVVGLLLLFAVVVVVSIARLAALLPT